MGNIKVTTAQLVSEENKGFLASWRNEHIRHMNDAFKTGGGCFSIVQEDLGSTDEDVWIRDGSIACIESWRHNLKYDGRTGRFYRLDPISHKILCNGLGEEISYTADDVVEMYTACCSRANA